jgi:hypothetical protein
VLVKRQGCDFAGALLLLLIHLRVLLFSDEDVL